MEAVSWCCWGEVLAQVWQIEWPQTTETMGRWRFLSKGIWQDGQSPLCDIVGEREGWGGGGVDEWGRGMKGKAEQGMWGKAFAARVYVPQGIERCGGMDSVERRTYTAFRFLHIINSSFFVTFGLFVASFK